MIDHVTLNVRDLEACKAFYEQALKPIGYELMMDFVEGCGYGAEGKPDFFLAQRGEPSAPVHVALRSPSRQTVDAFHEAALAAGGIDNGPPGVRRVYHEYYYGAYVLDPDRCNTVVIQELGGPYGRSSSLYRPPHAAGPRPRGAGGTRRRGSCADRLRRECEVAD